MTAKKKLVSTICIISLILALTAGVLLSVDSQSGNSAYVGNDLNLVNTGVSINAAGTMTSSSAKPSDAVEINSQDTLGSFLSGSASYGYITGDFELNWSGVGTSYALAKDRTIDGNGHTVTLKDDGGTVNQYKDTFDSHANFTGGFAYGMFVAANAGTIKNIKFKYDQSGLTLKNDTNNLLPNYAGLVCGTNTGVITNCDLDANGAIRYEVTGKLKDSDFTPEGDKITNWAFTVSFGGFAGRNAGLITNVKANYSGTTEGDYKCFDVSLNVTADNNSGVFRERADARTYAGGISGMMYTKESEISNVILTGAIALYFAPVDKQNTAAGNKASKYAIGAAVVGANSKYSAAGGGIGGGASEQGTVDNIIQGITVRYTGKLGRKQDGNISFPDEYSDNASVFCGKATNVTLIRDSINGKTVNGQMVNYQTDHCNCGVGTNAGQHDVGNSNLVYADAHSDIKVGMQAAVDAEGNPVLNGNGRQVYNQVITVTPTDSNNYMLGEFNFRKQTGRNEDAGAEGNTTGFQTSKGDDTLGDVPNGSTYLYTMEDVRQTKYTVCVEPYQASPARCWEARVYDYAIANVRYADTTLVPGSDTTMAWSEEYIYNGFDFLTQQLKYISKDGSKTGIVNPAGFNAISTGEDEKIITSGRLPGEYSFKLHENQYGLSYFNTEQRVVVFTADTVNLEPFTFKVVKADMRVKEYTVDYINSHWFNEVTDFNFEVVAPKVQDGAANGYVREVYGSKFSESGLTLTNDLSTYDDGRTYTVFLTSGGVQVTNPITYTVRVDLENPTLKLPHYEHADGRYYTHNRVSIDASDEHSGVASIMMYNFDYNGNQIGEPVDVIYECKDNQTGENDLSFIDEETGYYVWYFSYSGRIVIEVTDVAGLSVSRELNVNIDNFTPTISVDAYFYETYTDGDGNEQTKKSTYTNNKEVYSAVYFNATAQFGESGGEIQYSYNNTDWFTYTETLVVKVSGDVYLRALSNAFDHTDTYPYKKMYQVHTYWANNQKTENDVTVVTPFKVNVEVEHVAITLDDITVSNATKTFDGTNKFEGSIVAKPAFAAKINGDINFTAVYADVNASDEVAVKISASCTDNTKVLDNQFEDYMGSITKREISVVVDNKEKYFGYALPELTYTQSGMVEGFIEPIKLYVDKGDFAQYSYELLPQSKRDDTNNGYVITVVEGQTFKNYKLPTSNITNGVLQIDLAPIDRLVYNKGEFTGLDTNNIKTRNLEIGFMRVTGDYQKLEVKFERRVYDDSTGSLVTRWVLQRDMKTAPAGFYRVTISMPERTTIGNRVMADMYIMDDSVKTFMIKVIDASKFITDEEEPQALEDTKKTEQSAPVVIKDSAQQPSQYEGKSTSTDSTDTTIESTAKKNKDYIAIVSIFCAAIMVVAFAIGVGRAVMKRARK